MSGLTQRVAETLCWRYRHGDKACSVCGLRGGCGDANFAALQFGDAAARAIKIVREDERDPGRAAHKALVKAATILAPVLDHPTIEGPLNTTVYAVLVEGDGDDRTAFKMQIYRSELQRLRATLAASREVLGDGD